MKRHYILLLLTLLFAKGFSQTYPVANNIQLLPPYSIYLQDYTAPGTDQLKINLLLKDLTEPFYDVRLHLKIEGTGVLIENMPTIAVSPITIQGGVPITLTSSDLAPYFDIEKLNFSGISKNEFKTNGRLPEGYYRFCFTVVDYRRPDVQLSASQCASVWIVQNDPPLLNTPFCGSDLMLTDVQSIIFQWTPMHASSPNAAHSTEYNFELYEVQPKDRDPNDLVNSSTPLFEEITNFNNFFYGPSKPALIPGMQYAWRVKAIDALGRDLFKNSGYSEVCTFTFGKDVVLEPPTGITASAESQRRARMTWDFQADPTGYEVSYRKRASEGKWFTTTTEDIETLINDLEPNTSYEAQVISLLKTYKSEPSNTIFFTTPEQPEFSCGEEDVILDSLNFIPLKKAIRGSIFTVGKFDMKLLKVEGQDGTFSGYGNVVVPYISAKIACKFTNIKVNENHEVVAGTVEALTTGMEDMLAEWGKLPTDDDEEEDYTHADNFEGEDITVTGIIKDVKADTVTNTITIIKEDGTTEEYDLPNAEGEEDNNGGKRFTDEEGNVWVVTPDGDVKQVENGNNIPSTVPDSVKYLIVFEPDADSKYGFDAHDQKKAILPYEMRKYNDENYFMAWKSVETSKQDYIKVKEIVSKSSDFPEAIRFKSTVASLTTYNAEKGEKQLAVNAAGKGMTDEVYAYVVKTDSAGNEREEKIGSINVVSYDKVKEKVIIVPVNQSSPITETEIKTALNSIYKQAVAEWDVKMLKEINVEADYLQDWDTEESGLFASFPAAMRQFNRRCKEIIKEREGGFDKDAYYIFLIADDVSTRSGFMPFKRKYGYVFTRNTKNIAKTIAHELGHGAFRLRHTFVQHPALAKNTTQNLMDYTDEGKELYKYQWDFVHDPENMVGWFVDDEEGANINDFVMINTQFDLLLKHVYQNNKTGNLIYRDSINFYKSTGDTRGIVKVNYSGIEQEWVNSWFVKTSSSERILNSVITKLKDSKKNEVIPKINLTEKGIYIGEIQKDDKKHPVAIYCNRAPIENIKKVVVTNLYNLEKEENKKFIKSQESFNNYVVISFYEEGNEDPNLILQIEKLSGGSYTDERFWLKYLNILKEPIDNKSLEVIFNENESLTAEEIKKVREKIAAVEDASKKKEYYLELQEKVEYKNQNDNLGKNRQTSDNDRTNQYIAETMCNVTSLSMAFEYLGISTSDVLEKINNDPALSLPEDLQNAQLEDIIDFIRQKKDYGDRRDNGTWDEIAKYLGLEVSTIIQVASSKKAKHPIGDLKNRMGEGQAIVMSLALWKGHIVRLQDINENGIVIDDPYGTITSLAYREFKDNPNSFGYNKNAQDLTSHGRKGEDNFISWNDFDATIESTIGGSLSISGNKFVDEDDTETFQTWFSQSISTWAVDENEYIKSPKIDESGNTYFEYTTKGGIIKFYKVYSVTN